MIRTTLLNSWGWKLFEKIGSDDKLISSYIYGEDSSLGLISGNDSRSSGNYADCVACSRITYGSIELAETIFARPTINPA